MLIRGRTFGRGNVQQVAYVSVRCYAWDKLTCIGNLIPRISLWCDSVLCVCVRVCVCVCVCVCVWTKLRFPIEIDRQLIEVCGECLRGGQYKRIWCRNSTSVERITVMMPALVGPPQLGRNAAC